MENRRSKLRGPGCGPQRLIIVILFILCTALARAQTTRALHITSPANGAQVEGRLVMVQFELMPGISVNGIPKFRLQLDRQPPVLTSDNEYILNWLSPGWHTVTVWLLDANGTPIYGVQDQVQFNVEPYGP
ncbi:MAG TPA: hypothetical protein VMT05_12805 [Terriglobales bacterium]|jgi:hypothetical protein|nr:hypothetical protein [Terriglobales bacterium]